jgi:hypothetical protein
LRIIYELRGFVCNPLLEVEDEHLSDGLRRLTEDFTTFNAVPRYTYSIETLFGAKEALTLLGLKQ